MLVADAAKAGVWGVDPVLGTTGDYSTNPALLEGQHAAEAHGALLLNAPATYNADALSFSAIPSVRVSDSTGYSSVASDYEHLTVKGELDTERSALSAAATVNRDSSLYQDYLSDGATGVQRNTLVADLNWDRLLTERTDFDTDVNSSQVRYGQSVGIATLTSYRYTSISPTLAWTYDERSKVTAAASVGLYKSLDGTTMSRSANLQLGFVRQLTEIWSLTATAGYSRALNRLDIDEEFLVETPNGPAIEVIPLKIESAQNGTVYLIDLSRKGTLLSINAVASRQLIPSGFAFLSRQDSFELTANYALSDRWSFSADAHYLKAEDQQLQGGIVDRTPRYLSVSANWLFNEYWSVTFSASRVTERFQPPGIDLASNDVMITLSRRFNHITFH
jgi:hypothetical protein